MGLPRGSFELQTLFGMGDVIQDALVARGHRVRVYPPYGAMLPGMAYLVRRLLENTSNESFLKGSFTEKGRVDDLLRDPEETGSMLSLTRRSKPRTVPSTQELPPFHNEPVTDFAKAEEDWSALTDIARKFTGISVTLEDKVNPAGERRAA